MVALRYQSDQKIFSKKAVGGRSVCFSCERQLRWFELLPLVSFFVLRRRCLTCKATILWQYPIVEFLSGLIFATVPFYLARFYGIGNIFYIRTELWSFYLLVLVWILIFWFLLLLSVIDFRLYLIPNEINLILLFLGVAVTVLKFLADPWLLPFYRFFVKNYALIFSPFQEVVLSHLLGFIAGGLLFLFLYLLTRGRAMGFGDVKLAFALGLILGWPDIMLSSIASFFLGAIWGLVAILMGKKSLKNKIQFGPFLALGVFVVVFWGHSIVEWYFSLLAV